jgi:hypothetical protein
MIHHDSRPYEVAVAETKEKFEKRLRDQMNGTADRIRDVIRQVENDIPEDAIVLGKKLYFEPGEALPNLPVPVTVVRPDGRKLGLHDHALMQVAEKADASGLRQFIRDMQERGDEWAAKLIAHNLNELYHNQEAPNRYLLRQVRGELRGFLSDKFRRLDSRPLLDAFIHAVAKYGARPLDGFALDTKIKVRAMVPKVYEAYPGEIMAFGVQLTNSDYGDSQLAISGIVDRMWCTNLATTQDVLKKTHLGARLPDDVIFSEETYALDNKAYASAVKDVTKGVLSEGAIHGYLQQVNQANEQGMTATEINAWIKKNQLNKEDAQLAIAKFNSPDVELLPAGQTAWRWSNALSWLANETEDERKRLDLQDLAGSLLKEKKAA